MDQAGGRSGQYDDGTDTLIAEYSCDGLHRRIYKIVPDDPANPSKWIRTDAYYNASWQVVEERVKDDHATLADARRTVSQDVKYQYVWDQRYIDAPVCRDEDKNSDGDCTDDADGVPGSNTGDEHLYYYQDANYNVTALVEDYDGEVVERYMYSPYGRVTVLHGVRDSSGTDTSASEWSARTSNTFENALLYCGYYHDNETGLCHVRHRCYHPTLGRWLSRDPIRYVGGRNLYAYVASNPLAWSDAWGLRRLRPHELKDFRQKVMLELRRKGTLVWTLSPEGKHDLSDRAAWFCGRGLTGHELKEGVDQLMFDVATEVLLPGPVKKILKAGEYTEKAIREARELMARDYQTICISDRPDTSPMPKESTASTQESATTSSSCFCRLCLAYDIEKETFKGTITGVVGDQVTSIGETSCCNKEHFDCVFAGRVSFEEKGWWIFRRTEIKINIPSYSCTGGGK